MAFITYPLNNIDYTAEDAELFHCTRTSGIWAEDSFSISVTGADNNVTIGTGIAWINNEEFSGKVAALKSAKTIDLGIADGVYPRIDVIAIQYNANNNATDVVIKKGTPATNPVQPAIVRSGAVYELYLASVYRPAGATAITASNITDLRMDETVCGLMADSVTKVDMTAIEAQIRAFINNLQSEIDSIRDLSGLMFESEWVEDGVIPVLKGGTDATTAEEALANLGGISIVKLWQNASPTSEFANQTIENVVSANNDYDIIIAIFNSHAEGRNIVSFSLKGWYGEVQFIGNLNSTEYDVFNARRIWMLSTSGDLMIGDCDVRQSGRYNTNNIYLLPYVVYGIKGVQ